MQYTKHNVEKKMYKNSKFWINSDDRLLRALKRKCMSETKGRLMGQGTDTVE